MVHVVQVATLTDVLLLTSCARRTGGREVPFASVLSIRTEREREALKMRFGLDEGYPRTLEEGGRYFKVTREHIR